MSAGSLPSAIFLVALNDLAQASDVLPTIQLEEKRDIGTPEVPRHLQLRPEKQMPGLSLSPADVQVSAEAQAKAKKAEQARLKAEAKAKAEEEARAAKQAKLEAKAKAKEEAEAKKAQAKAVAEAKKAEQAKIAAEAKAAKQAKAEEQAKLKAEAKAKAEEEARVAKQAKLEAKAKARKEAEAKKAEQARIAAEAKAAKQAKAEEQAKLKAEAKAKAEEEARVAKQAKLEAKAKARKEAEAKKAEQARIAAEAKAAKQAKAEEQAKLKAEAKAKAKEEARVAKQAKLEAQAKAREETEARKAEQARIAAEAKAKAEEEARATKQAKLAAKAKAKEEAKAKKVEQTRIAAEAKAAKQAKAEEQAKLKAEAKAKAEEEARTAKQAKLEAKAKAKEEAKAKKSLAKAVEQAKAEEVSSRTQAKTEDKTAEQAKAETEVKTVEEAKIKAEELARAEAETKAADLAKLEAEAKAKSEEEAKINARKLAVDYAALGKERARILAGMNKSLTVELPPAEFLAQPDEGVARVKNLSLLDATALALDYSNEVSASAAHKDSSEYLAAASLGPLLPHADLKISGGQEDSTPSMRTNDIGARYPSDKHHRADRELHIRQTLMDLPSYFERERQNLLLKSAKHSLSNTQERVAYDTLVSFLKLIQLRLDVVLAKNYEIELKKLLEYMAARAEAGGSTQADMQRVKGRVINTRSTVIEAQGAYESGLVEFRRLTGVVPSSLSIPESLLPMLPKDFETAMASAIQNNNELQAALRDAESVAQERRAMLGRFAPKLDIELSSIHTYNAGGIADSAPNQNAFPAQDDKRAMLVMTWSLLNGGADRMQSKALESKRAEYEYRAREIQRKLEESLRVNFNALHSVGGRVNGVMQEMESNDLVLAAFNEQLFAANRSLLDVLDAYQRQYSSRTELTRLLIAEATAGLQMLRNTGQLQEGIAALR